MTKQTGQRAGLPVERIVVDECLGLDTPLVAQLTGQLVTGQLGDRPVDVVMLAARHPGIPDVEILDKLMDARTALLTRDRALHNLTIDRGFRSYVQSPDGSLTSRKLPEIVIEDRGLPAAKGGVRDSYVYETSPEAQVIKGCLAAFMSEHQLKQFRTKRRRIRAHFGSLDNIAAVALTIGQRRAARGIIGGYLLKVDARHGAKSLSPASEGYFLASSGGDEPLQSLIWALAHVLMLQLETRPLTVFACGSDVEAACTTLVAGGDAGHSSVERMAVRLLAAMQQPQAQPCRKGRFFDRMQAKLQQLTATDSNELVPIDPQAMAAALEAGAAFGVEALANG